MEDFGTEEMAACCNMEYEPSRWCFACNGGECVIVAGVTRTCVLVETKESGVDLTQEHVDDLKEMLVRCPCLYSFGNNLKTLIESWIKTGNVQRKKELVDFTLLYSRFYTNN
jgi:hypothetical protein